MTPWQPLQLLVDRACWWKQVCRALLEPGMGSRSPLPRLSLMACPGRGPAQRESVVRRELGAGSRPAQLSEGGPTLLTPGVH